MKKIIGLIFILCLSTEICFSETRKLEGYDGLTWGTTLEEFKKLNLDYKKLKEGLDKYDFSYNRGGEEEDIKLLYNFIKENI